MMPALLNGRVSQGREASDELAEAKHDLAAALTRIQALKREHVAERSRSV